MNSELKTAIERAFRQGWDDYRDASAVNDCRLIADALTASQAEIATLKLSIQTAQKMGDATSREVERLRLRGAECECPHGWSANEECQSCKASRSET